MAMQAGLSSPKVLILVGAGLTSSVMLRNGRLSEVLSELQELMKGVNEADGTSTKFDVSALAAQIRHLAQEVRDMKLSRPVTILNGESSSSGLASYIMPAAAVGTMGYCYMWWKGWSFSDVMFATKRTMADAVSVVSKQMEQVSTALAATKRHLTQRIDKLDGKLDEQKETSKLIMNEVTEVKTGLGQIEFDIESIRKMISDVEGTIELIEAKQDMTLHGIDYLCKFAGGVKDGISAKFFQEARNKLEPSRPSSTISMDKTVELKGLEFFTQSKQMGDAENYNKPILHKDLQEPNKTIPKAATVLRTYPIVVLPK